MNEKLFDFIKRSPSAYHAISSAAAELEASGLSPLSEGAAWRIEHGRGYFTTRNGSSIIAFKIPEGDPSGFMISAAHSDSPCFKIKENPEFKDKSFIRLSTEKYGGMLMATWLDRPLSIAGRVAVKTEDGVETRLVDFVRPVAVIPSVAIHMNRSANDSASYNPAVDMVPLAGIESDFSVKKEAARLAGVPEDQLLAHDLFLYNPQPGAEWNGAISSPRLDDLQCAFSSLEAFKNSTPRGAISVCCIFDNEEVGSATKQGAASTFLADTLERIYRALGKTDEDFKRALASGMMASCDNAHSVHPNHPEYSDRNCKVVMNGGVVIKYNANQRYTTDAVSSALFKVICERAGVPTQSYANRPDIPGGSTLGSIANTKVPVNTVDIGLAQLSMHSSYETAGGADTEYLVRALEEFFSSSVVSTEDGKYTVR